MADTDTSQRPSFAPAMIGPAVVPTPRWIRVRLGDAIVADSKRALLLRQYGPGRLPTYYFPQSDVRTDLLIPTTTSSRCPYKGVASYWSARIGDRLVPDIAWGYPAPIPECPKIAGHLCFFNERVDLYIDGELQPRPLTPWTPSLRE